MGILRTFAFLLAASSALLVVRWMKIVAVMDSKVGSPSFAPGGRAANATRNQAAGLRLATTTTTSASSPTPRGPDPSARLQHPQRSSSMDDESSGEGDDDDNSNNSLREDDSSSNDDHDASSSSNSELGRTAASPAIESRTAAAESSSFVATRPPPPRVTILCHMSGEVGNHLDIYAHCHVLWRMLSGAHPSNASLVVRHANGGGWTDPIHNLQSCFPHFRSVDFEEGSKPEYDHALLWQQQLLARMEAQEKEEDYSAEAEEEQVRLGPDQLVRNAFVTMATRHEPTTVRDELDAFAHRLSRSSDLTALPRRSNSSTDTIEGAEANRTAMTFQADLSDSPIHPLSVLYVQWLFSVDAFVDQYIGELRDLYTFLDTSADCCRSVPDSDETVFHLRNFVVEMPNLGKELGFQELSPNQTAADLFGHLRPGDRVAIVSRFGIEHAQPYVDALEGRGLQARLVTGQSGLQDFCFLMRAQKEVVGMAISTFFMWAALLGNCGKVTAYSVDTPYRREMFGDGHVTYNFTHPLLAGRFAFPLISPVDDD